LIFREKHKAIEVVAAGDKLDHIRDLHHLICGTTMYKYPSFKKERSN